jgi:sialidase-1
MDLIRDVFISGEDHYGSYRIPSLLHAGNGILLAFAEARKELNDHAENKIVLKRSADHGDSWGALLKLADAGRDSLNNPLAVQVEKNGRILLMYQRYPLTTQSSIKDPDLWRSHEEQEYPPNIHEAAVGTGYEGRNICRTYMITSEDDGITWSGPTEITRSVKRPEHVTNYAGGPGIGIQIRKGRFKGRIIMPFSRGPWSDMKVYAVYSDDYGDTWEYGEAAPDRIQGMPNEVQVVELEDGALMLNARPFKGKPYRMISFSLDGGNIWSELEYDTELEDPGCQGSILRLTFAGPGQESLLLFSNPRDKVRRINGTIRLSNDEGKSWKWAKSIYKGSFAYSCLAKLTDQEIAILFERDNYSKISFSKLNIKWLIR